MTHPKIKICGITNLKDAQLAIDYGADAIGFIFYDKSPRNIDIETASSISKKISKNILKVGVFVNESHQKINFITKSCDLDLLQLHGTESIDDCNTFKIPVIKAFHVKSVEDIDSIEKYKEFIDYILLDTKSKNEFGGTGKTFDWNIAKKAKKHNIPLFLSGGISSNNILDAINTVNPEFIDLSSSIELSPGIKDEKKLRDLFNILKK